ncbi:probable outer membrane protein, OmpW family [Psychrobacter arcticus 273-4]|uniref:Probable outer membrane protein, OmpW family n=1 Tax=Psychrobacter arcticus (strain DSM 17307 / VKM B-2377 / 273-4) TaxID=259536 RepID=Q4FS32_PSYA2|nr:OmpW family outer membrane protein [Psychrobacter arcticus]AAZ19176.1 probable outer membrane protein, OmpW family [Psychrobacter arcticus 273-4]
MKLQSLVLAAATALTMTTAFAVPAGTWTVAAGAHYVDPKSDNGTLNNGLSVDVDGDVRPTISGEYFIANNVGVELLAAIPFHHDFTLNDATGKEILTGKTQHLPPTLSLQYHFDDYNLPMNVKPFIGVGVNYTTFFKEKLNQPGADLKLDDNVGIAGHIGLDIPFAPTEAFRIDARYMDIKTDATLNGTDIGEIDISPWVYGVAFVKQF